MSEETELNVSDAEIVTEELTPKVSATEEEARSKGWRPESEFEGNKEDFVSAKEFLRVGEMITRHKELERSIRAVSKQNQEIMSKFQNAEVQGYQRAIEELKAQRKEAISYGDTDRADQITQNIDSYKAAEQQATYVAQQNRLSPEIQEFLGRNSDWFKVDPILTQYATLKDAELRRNHPEKSEAEILQMVEQEFSPRYKKNPAKTPPQVATPSRSSDTGASGKLTVHDLSKDEAYVYKSIHAALRGEDQTAFTVDSYVKQLKATGAR